MPRMNEEDSGTNSQGVSTDGRITLLRVVKATRKFFVLWGCGGGETEMFRCGRKNYLYNS
jgi:hypothetical protein